LSNGEIDGESPRLTNLIMQAFCKKSTFFNGIVYDDSGNQLAGQLVIMQDEVIPWLLNLTGFVHELAK